MKLYCLLAVGVLLSLHTSAQNILTGKITDQNTKKPIVFAGVFIPDLQKGTVTDTSGYFEIKDLPIGTYLVEFSRIGYSSKVLKANINGDTVINIELSASVVETEHTVITGTPTSTKRVLNPIPTIVINNISKENASSTNIIDAISKQPGISQITTGGAISKPVIRGLSYNRVVVLNNNIRQEGQQWGDEHGIEIDEYSVERVEIIKGAGSLMYGSDAMAGVIHFLAPKPIKEGTITSKLMTNYQTNNGLIGYSLVNAGNIKGINWLARISSKKAGNYQNDYDGKVYNSGFEELNFNSSIGIDRKWGYSQLHFSNFGQTLALVEGERDASGNFIKSVIIDDTTSQEQTVSNSDLDGYKIGIPRQEIGHLKIASTSKFFINKSKLSVNLAYQQNSRKEFADIFDPQAEELYFLLNTINYDIKHQLAPMKGWHTSVGINGMQQSSFNKGEEYVIPEYDLFDAGVFAFTQKSFDKLLISGGLRYDIRNIDSHPLYLNEDDEPTNVHDSTTTTRFNGFDASFSNYSTSIGASYRISKKLTAKVNFSRGFRSPNMAELGSNGIHEGSFRYELGNSNLKPETSFQIDAGILYRSEHVSFELAAFNNSIQNYIFLKKLNSQFGGDSIIDPSDPAPTFQFVQGDANLYGGELAIDIHPHPLDWLHFKNSFSFVKGKQLNQPDSSSSLPFMPAPKFQSELRANFKKVGSFFRNFFIEVGASYTFEQTEVHSAFGTETPTSSYTLVNARVGTDIVNSNGHKTCSFSFAVSNLFDESYQSHLSRLKYGPENLSNGRTGVFNMGRNFSMRLVIPLTLRNSK